MEAALSNPMKTRILVSTCIPPEMVECGCEAEGETPNGVAWPRAFVLFIDKNLSIIRKHKRRRRFRRWEKCHRAELRLKTAEAPLEFKVRMIAAAVVKDVARAEEIRVFSGPGEAEFVDVTFDAKVTGEIKGSIDGEARDDGAGGAAVGEALDGDGWAVGACYGKAAAELGDAESRGGGSGLSVRPACKSKNAGEATDTGETLQNSMPPKNESVTT
jgi:hypothetical protein